MALAALNVYAPHRKVPFSFPSLPPSSTQPIGSKCSQQKNIIIIIIFIIIIDIIIIIIISITTTTSKY